MLPAAILSTESAAGLEGMAAEAPSLASGTSAATTTGATTAGATGTGATSSGNVWASMLGSSGIDIETSPVKVMTDGINNVMSTATGIAQMFGYQSPSEERAQKQLDKQFNEDVRRYNLNYALQRYATRKGISMQEAQNIYNQSVSGANLSMNQLQNQSAMKSQAAGRAQDEIQFGWQKLDRDRQMTIARAYARGLAKGLLKK
jgi:hypothetical protein